MCLFVSFYSETIIKSSPHADLFLIRGISTHSGGNHVHDGDAGGGLRRVAASAGPGAPAALLTSIGGAGGQWPWAECASWDRATAASSSTRSTQPLAGGGTGPGPAVDPGIQAPAPPAPPAPPPAGGAGAGPPDAEPSSGQSEKKENFYLPFYLFMIGPEV